jgi:hypothetical protein
VLLESSVGDLKKKEAPRGAEVICMRHYPRFLPKRNGREYRRVLAPDERLFREFRDARLLLQDHNRAFDAVEYEKRFWLSQSGLEELERWASMARRRNVVFFCQCKTGEKCHRHLLLLMAQKFFQVRIAPLPFEYPIFRQRLRGENSVFAEL